MSVLTTKQVSKLDRLTRFMQDPKLGTNLESLLEKDIVSGTPVNAVNATVVLTLATQPTIGDTFTIGSTVYTFVDVAAAAVAGDVEVGADLEGAKTNVIAAINGTDGINDADPKVSAGTFSTNDLTLTALVAGTSENSVATTETFTDVGNVFNHATLTGGVNGTVAEAGTTKVDSSYLYVAVADNTVSGKNWRRISVGSAF